MSRLPVVRDGALIAGPHDAPVPVGTPQWFAWLSEARSFTFASTLGAFTARHEERSGSRFWYAYRQRDGVLRKTYLGRSADVTPQRLEQAAQVLARAGNARGGGNAPDDWSSLVIATKIAAPQPGLSLVARPAVVARCLESIERPCTIIAAPAGFGKTTLLIMAGEQLKGRGWQVAWVSLEETEQDPVRFWTYTLAALDRAQSGIGVAARRLLETPRPPAIERVLTALINELATATTPIALVLDDYHRAATPASDHGLAFLIEHMPTTLHLVVTTRSEPAFPLARLRAQGRIAELRTADLRFSAEEAGRFMRETMHVALEADQLARLDERTEGWVAGLQLAALSLRDQAGTPDLVADMSTAPRYIAEYLIDEVLEHQPEEVQNFLLQTAPLERLTGPLCDAVTGRTDSAAMLVRLMQAQLFVTPLDLGQTWYRYHHLFAEVLRERLQRTAPDVLQRCHRRAAEWLRQQGTVGEAIRHLLAAQALSEAATLIEGECDQLVFHGEIAGLVAWVRVLPRDVVLARPHLCVLFAAALLLWGEAPEATAWLDDLEQSLAETGTPSVEIGGEIVVIRAILILIAGDIAGAAARARAGLQQLPVEDHLLRALALWLISITGVAGDDDLLEVADRITGIAEDSLHAGNLLVALIALSTRAGVEMFQGRLHRAAQTCREALRLLPRKNGEELPIMSQVYCTLGEIRREWNDLDGAEDDLRHALALGLYPSNPEFLIDGLISLAVIQAERDRGDEALATFEEIRHLIRKQRLAAIDIYQMEYVRARVLLMYGHVTEAARWADERRNSRKLSDPLMDLAVLREAEDLALARVALAQGCADADVALLEDLCAHAERGGRLRNALEARMLLARARWMAGETEAALRDLEASLALAAPEGFVRIFLDEGELMADLLAGYVASRPPSRERAHALKLLAALGRAAEPSALPLSITLSPRELDVLRLLATGHSNEMIASELVVALSTVKWHVAHIYRKLGVTGRVRVVARARELHLIA